MGTFFFTAVVVDLKPLSVLTLAKKAGMPGHIIREFRQSLLF